jgi:hypothetical protein
VTGEPPFDRQQVPFTIGGPLSRRLFCRHLCYLWGVHSVRYDHDPFSRHPKVLN